MRTARELQALEKRIVDGDSDVSIYQMGIFYAAVCSRLGATETVRRVNNLMEGVTSWSLSDDKTFATGDPHPKPCEQTPGRTHYLLE